MHLQDRFQGFCSPAEANGQLGRLDVNGDLRSCKTRRRLASELDHSVEELGRRREKVVDRKLEISGSSNRKHEGPHGEVATSTCLALHESISSRGSALVPAAVPIRAATGFRGSRGAESRPCQREGSEQSWGKLWVQMAR